MSGYFNKFATIQYDGSLATNIIARARIATEVRNKTAVFFPYTIREGDRPDTIADAYYGDSRYAWLVYFCNEIVDPYFQWPLYDNQFVEFIKTKYGSVEFAQEKIVFYQVNWSTDDSIISIATFNGMPDYRKKYWQPVLDFKGNIVSYQRKSVDWVVETNKVVELTQTGGDNITIDDIVKQSQSGSVIATGVVKFVSSTKIIVEKITGQFITGVNITNFNQTETASISDVATINQPLSNDEAVYWEPITAFDYEAMLNEQKKEIYLIDKRYLDKIETEMKALLR